MFERFTEPAQQTVFFARAEAGSYGSRQIETEHFLLALLQESDGLLRQLLGNVATASALEHEVRNSLGVTEPAGTAEDLALSHELKRVLAFSAEAAERLNDRSIGTGHLLLGLLRESECAAARALTKYGVTRERALDALHAGGVLPETGQPPAVMVTRERLHELVDSLPEGAWQHAFGSLNYLQVWPPRAFAGAGSNRGTARADPAAYAGSRSTRICEGRRGWSQLEGRTGMPGSGR